MPSICILVIQECPGGIAVDQLPVERGTELERSCAGVMDLGLRLAQEALAAQITAGSTEAGATMIEGKDIEKYVRNGLKDIGAKIDFRKLLNEAGFRIKGKE